MKWFIILFIFSFPLFSFAQNIVINEVSSINSSAWIDEDYDSPDWIELKNIGQSPINLNEYRISDKDDAAKAWVLPDTTLNPNDIILISASDKSYNSSGKYVIEADGSGIVPTHDEDGFAYLYMPFAGDFVAEFDFSSMRNTGTFGAAGITFKEELTDEAKFFGVYNLRQDRTTYGLMRRTELEKETEIDYSYHHNVYPWGLIRLERKGGTIIAYDKENGFEWREFARFDGAFKQNGYLGLGFSSAKLEKQGKFTFSSFKVNGEEIDIESLDLIDIKLVKASKLYKSNEVHTDFKLSRSGETLTLWNAAGDVEDQLTVPAQNVDISYARVENGEMKLSYPSTPNAENDNFYVGRCEIPTLKTNGGFFEHSAVVSFNSKSGETIRYTLDGSEPTDKSITYAIPLEIKKTSVLRAKAFADNKLPSKTLTRTFFIGVDNSLPFISMATDSLNLWDEDTGLFIDKNLYWPNDKLGHFEIWNKEDELEMYSDGTMRLHGQKSRRFEQKSIRFHANSISDSTEFTHPFFGNESYKSYNKILFRNGGTGWSSAIITDAYACTLLKDMPSVIVGNSRAGVSYLNGKFYGIVNIREKVDEDLIAEKYNISSESINFIEDEFVAGNGSAGDFYNDYMKIMSMDMNTDEAYKYVADNIELDNLYDYLASQIFICNIDWPWKNVKYWMSEELDGKWRFVPHDMDYSFGCSAAFWEYDIFPLIQEDKTYPNFIRKLWENRQLKEETINRICDLMNSRFLPENTRPILEIMEEEVEPYIQLQKDTYAESAEDWHYSMDKMRAFADRRAFRLKEHMTKYFNCGDSALVHLDLNNKEAGYVRVNSLTLKSFPWSGFYFTDVPITIEAVAYPGHKFLKWSDDKYGTNPKITFKPDEILNLIAIFDKSEEALQIVINEIMYKASDDHDTGDWIELYNPNTSSVNLSNWQLTDSNPDNIFTFENGTMMAPESYLVIARKGDDFSKYHHDIEYLDDLGFGLSDEDAVKLYNETGDLVDSVEYTASVPWPTSADGTGLSIELIDTKYDNSLGENWAASLNINGTPGSTNSVDTSISTVGLSAIQVYPNPSSDYLFIRTKMENFGYKIYSMQGELIAQDKSHYLEIIDCHDLPVGTYYIEVMSDNESLSLPFVVIR